MTVPELSARQQKIIEFIRSFWEDQRIPPTVRDIVNGCGVSSTSVVDYNLDILEKKGYIRRHSGVSRGIELLARLAHEHYVQIPLVGIIAAGSPMPVPAADVWDTISTSETIDVTMDMIQGRRDVYALKVKGVSMIDALINDGDILLMQYVNTVQDGDMAAVWLKAEKEVTLKKVYRDGKRIRLQPANSQVKPIYTRPDNVEIQGRVIAVVRQLA
ncbi:MAG: repressor LexA [Chloroflexi bacterium]|nr:repressor LexA [Chloroflexota bacterium]